MLIPECDHLPPAWQDDQCSNLVANHYPAGPATDGPHPLPPIRARDWIEQRQGRYARDGVSDIVELH